MSTRILSRAALLTALAAAAPRPAAAQAVRGTLVSAADGAPIEGALVTLVDGAGRAAATALSRADGTFRLAAAEAGRYRVLARRIGFAPERSDEVALAAGGETPLRLSIRWAPATLGGAVVTGAARCPGAGPSARTVALLAEARTALEVVRATRAEARFGAEVETRERFVTPDGRPLGGERRVTRSGPTTTPFASAGADSLAARGFVWVDAAEVQFHAPDADVLLSDAFQRTHCVVDAPTRDGLAGVGFRPAPGVDRPEVRGTMWLDARSSELRRIDFQYVNLPRALERRGADGDVSFARVDGGRWVVSSWRIRMPWTDPATARVYRVPALDREATGRVTRVYELAREGTRVAERVDGVAERGIVEGTIFDSLLTNAPLRGATVLVRGTALSAETDSAGRFVLAGVPVGEQVIGFTHPALDSLGLAPAPRALLVPARDTTVVSLSAPSPGALLAAACGGGGRPATALVLGRVRDAASGAPVAGAAVVVEWSDAAPGAPARRLDAEAGRDGSFRLCALPPNGLATARARADSSAGTPARASGPVALPLDRGALHALDLTVAPDGEPGAGRPAGRASVAGVVLGADGAPAAGATVRVDGTRAEARSDARGAFRLAALPGGTQTLRVTRLGAAPAWTAVQLAAGREASVTVRLAPTTQALAVTRVTAAGGASAAAAQEFRRLAQPRSDVFLTREQYALRKGANVLDPLRTVAAKVVKLAYGNVQIPMLAVGTRGACVPLVYADGRRLDLGEVVGMSPEGVEMMAAYRTPGVAPIRDQALATQLYDGATLTRVRPRRSGLLERVAEEDEGMIAYGPECGVVMILTRSAR